jgi:outer membrane protein OmpA-like peptidoglycan-associated protein
MAKQLSKKHVSIHMKQKLTLLFLFFFGIINAQNLVLNPSFEAYTRCPKNYSEFNKNVSDWSTPTKGTSDYYNNCNTTFGSFNPRGSQNPHEGDGFAGIVTYFEDRYSTTQNYREYIQGKLKTTLIKNKRYSIKVRISLADESNFALNQLSVVLLELPININSKSFIDLNNLKKDTVNYHEIVFKNDSFFTAKDHWITLEKEFVANGFEKYICFGNFKSNKKTENTKVGKYFLPIESYYFVDNISIIEEQDFSIEKTYTFKNVLFDFDKAELLKTSIQELDKLSLHLKENNNLNIEIYGHTDNVGETKRNNELSLLRAKSVSNYLINKGLKPEHIKWFGFGSSKPITNNNTEDNRAKNRRVEFKLIKKTTN